MTITKKQFEKTGFLLVYKIITEIVYAKYVAEIFGYSGLKYTPNYEKAIISYVVFFVLLLIPENKEESVSKYLLNTFFIFTIVPILCVYWQINQSTKYVFMVALSYSLLAELCLMPNYKKPHLIRIGDLSRVNILVILLAVNVLALIALTVRFGLADLRALIFSNIYDLRSERSYNGIWGYIIRWITYAFVPSMLCIALNKKQKIYVFIAIFFQFYMFLHTGMKSTFFSIGLILYTYYLIYKKADFVKWWVIALIGLNFVSIVLLEKFNSLTLFSIFPVRLSTIPAKISFNHYEFFSNNPKLYFAENIIGRLLGIRSPYRMHSTFLLTGGDGNANTGFLGDAYDNGGFVCIVVYTLILAITLRYIDRLSNRAGVKALPVYTGIMTNIMLYLNDCSLTSCFFTGGLFIILLIFNLYEELVYESNTILAQ